MVGSDAILAIIGMICSGLVGALVFSFRSGSAYERVNQQLKFINSTLDKLEHRMDRFEQRYNYDGQYYTYHAKRKGET